MAARTNSSRAPHAPPWRRLRRRRMRFGWASSISTFFRSRAETAYASSAVMVRAIRRALSWIERGNLRCDWLGQHRGLSGPAPQALALAHHAVFIGQKARTAVNLLAWLQRFLGRSDVSVLSVVETDVVTDVVAGEDPVRPERRVEDRDVGLDPALWTSQPSILASP